MANIQEKFDGALVATQIKLNNLMEKQEGQNSIEYAGMIAVAGIVVGAIVIGARTWAPALSDKISEVVTNLGANN